MESGGLRSVQSDAGGTVTISYDPALGQITQIGEDWLIIPTGPPPSYVDIPLTPSTTRTSRTRGASQQQRQQQQQQQPVTQIADVIYDFSRIENGINGMTVLLPANANAAALPPHLSRPPYRVQLVTDIFEPLTVRTVVQRKPAGTQAQAQFEHLGIIRLRPSMAPTLDDDGRWRHSPAPELQLFLRGSAYSFSDAVSLVKYRVAEPASLLKLFTWKLLGTRRQQTQSAPRLAQFTWCFRFEDAGRIVAKAIVLHDPESRPRFPQGTFLGEYIPEDWDYDSGARTPARFRLGSNGQEYFDDLFLALLVCRQWEAHHGESRHWK